MQSIKAFNEIIKAREEHKKECPIFPIDKLDALLSLKREVGWLRDAIYEADEEKTKKKFLDIGAVILRVLEEFY